MMDVKVKPPPRKGRPTGKFYTKSKDHPDKKKETSGPVTYTFEINPGNPAFNLSKGMIYAVWAVAPAELVTSAYNVEFHTEAP
jgi:hypothetical protein